MTEVLKYNAEEVWKKAYENLKSTVAQSTWPWLEPLTPVSKNEEQYKKDAFVLKSHQSFGVAYLNQRFLPEIQAAIDELIPEKPKVEIVFVQEEIRKKRRSKTSEKLAEMQRQLENLKQMNSFSSLNLKYTFENFVNSENSNVAYNAAKLTAQNPGKKFNPLFITGSVGIGKTHLMQAIGHEIIKNFPNLKVKYAKTEEFTNQLIDSCRHGIESYQEMKKFRDKYRNIDVLLLDDIQFAEGKKRTEEEIFNTFDALFHQGKQIVFASDRPIETFQSTPDRLKSRYEWGLEVEILPPSLETRITIIKNHAKRSEFEITDDVAEFLAKNYSKNIRELEGAYNKVSAYASIQGIELNVNSAKEILGFRDNTKKITTESIIAKCAEYFNTTPEAIKGNQRAANIKNARQIAIYLSRYMLDLSFPAIAKHFNKNHTTILYSYEKLKREMQVNKPLKQEIEKIENLITQ